MREGAADAVVRGVQRQIARDALPAGHRIGTKGELGVTFGVSPATLGEALRVLRGRGVVDVRPGPGGGVFVAVQSPLLRLAQTVLELRDDGASTNDVTAVLDGLDQVVARDAARYRTTRDLEDLDHLASSLQDAWSEPQLRSAAVWALHVRVADISPNPVLRAFYVNLVAYLGDSLDQPEPTSGFDPASPERLQVHLDLVEAIRSGRQTDVDAAADRHRRL